MVVRLEEENDMLLKYKVISIQETEFVEPILCFLSLDSGAYWLLRGSNQLKEYESNSNALFFYEFNTTVSALRVA